MRKNIYVLFIIVFILMVHINVLADNKCSSEETKRLKALADLVELKYDYKINDVKVGNTTYKEESFSITASNLHKDLLVMIIENDAANKYKEFKNNNGSYTMNGFKAGQRVEVTIKAFVANACSGDVLAKKTIKLPYYNIFISDERCQKYPEFKYCSEWLDTPVERNVFNTKITEYIKTLDNGKPIDKSGLNTTLLYIIIGGVVGIIALTSLGIVIAKKRKKNAL